MKFLDAVGPIAISLSVWSQLLDENEKGRSVTSFQDVSLDGMPQVAGRSWLNSTN